jgi:Phosphoribosylaminoimidazole (AIR) synthetase
MTQNPYAKSGVDTQAGDLAVELMKKSVSATHNDLVLGGFGGFAGMIDAKFMKDYDHPILATPPMGLGPRSQSRRRLISTTPLVRTWLGWWLTTLWWSALAACL